MSLQLLHHRQNYSIGILQRVGKKITPNDTVNHRQNYSIDIFQLVKKQLAHFPFVKSSIFFYR